MHLLGLLADSCRVAAWEDKGGWVTSEGLFFLNEDLLAADSTWERWRQSPLGREDRTMSGPAVGRR
jgi:hypothetical protein